MYQAISTMQVREQLGELLNRVSLRNEQFVIERKGKPIAILSPVKNIIEEQRAARKRMRQFMESLKGQNSDLTEEAAMAIANEAKRAVRKQMK